MTDHAALAEAYFKDGCNCAQSVFCAFEDVTGFDHETSLRLGSSYGGGFGRLREVCGAFSAAAGVLGLLYGYTDLTDPQAKADHYALVQALAADFKADFGTIVCRELLGKAGAASSPVPSPRTAEYHATRPCGGLVRRAAELVDRIMESRQAEAEK